MALRERQSRADLVFFHLSFGMQAIFSTRENEAPVRGGSK